MLRKTIWLAGALALAIAACDNDDDLINPPGNTAVTILLTDAPGDILAAVVTIDQVFVQDGENDRVDLLTAPVTVDLTTLATTTSELVSGAQAANGTYDDLRFIISGAYIEVDNGDGTSTIFASSADYAGLPAGAVVGGQLQMPSLGTSGLKVDFGDAIELDGGSVQYLVDFDVSQSFGQEAGGSGNWVMNPVIKGGNSSDAGTVNLTLTLGAGVTLPEGVTLADFSADLGGELAEFADAGDGAFTASFPFLLPGTYELTLVGPEGLTLTTDPVLPLQVTVGAAATVAQTITISAVE
jgi:hypothetical protein